MQRLGLWRIAMQFYDPASTQNKPDLNAEVEKWLKDKSNKITKLPFGFTHYKDGNIPMSKKPVQQLDIEKYNVERVTRHKPVKSKKLKSTKSKTVKPRGHKPKIAKQKRFKKLVVFTERSMIYMHNCVAFKNARENELIAFEALCIRHTYSTFKKQKNGRYRCEKCLEDYNENNLSNYKRHVLNRELMNVAISAGNNKFLGVCKTHGESQFLIARTENTISKYLYKCRICANKTQMKARKKKGAIA